MAEYKDHNLDEYLDFVKELSKKAGELAEEKRSGSLDVQIKTSGADLVTEADKATEEFIFQSLKKKYPNHSFIGEETVAGGIKPVLTDEPCWIVDPIDGTTNFIHQFPFYCVSIGLVINKKPVVGVVYLIAQKCMYYARVGGGAFRNGVPIHVSSVTERSKSLILTEWCSANYEIAQKRAENMLKLWHGKNSVQGIRSMGSAASNMCMVAHGFCELYFESGIRCWDIAAGSVIVTEAGGYVSDFKGKPLDLMSRSIVASNSKKLSDQFDDIERISFYPRDD